MFCIECGRKIPDTAKFCAACGNPQGRKSVQTKNQIFSKENKKVHESSEAIALYVLSLLFFFMGIYFFNGIWYETMCEPSMWVPDDCDGIRGAILGCILISIACFAGGIYLTNNDPRNKS